MMSVHDRKRSASGSREADQRRIQTLEEEFAFSVRSGCNPRT